MKFISAFCLFLNLIEIFLNLTLTTILIRFNKDPPPSPSIIEPDGGGFWFSYTMMAIFCNHPCFLFHKGVPAWQWCQGGSIESPKSY